MVAIKAVQEDVAGLLNGSALTWCGVALVSGTNLAAGHEKPAVDPFPPAYVFVLEFGGPPIQPYLSSSRKGYVQAYAQILGRCDREQEAVGLADMRAIMAFLQQKDVRGIGYTACYVDQAAPAPWGLGKDNLYRWSVNVRMEYKG